MTITITDPMLVAQLKSATGDIEFRGPQGEFLAHIIKSNDTPPVPALCPISDEEIARRRKAYYENPDDVSTHEEVWNYILSKYS